MSERVHVHARSQRNGEFNFERDVIDSINTNDRIPHGREINIAAASVSMGGPKNAVWLQGEAGVGKSELMAALLGSAGVYDTIPGTTGQDMLGYERAVDGGENYGSLGKHLLQQETGEEVLGIDELGRLGGTSALHRIFNGSSFSIGDGSTRIDTRRMPFMVTSNYPDGEENFDFDPAMKSRLGLKLLIASEGMHINDDERDTDYPGIVPPRHIREQLAEMMAEHKPDGSVDEFVGRYIETLNNSGMTAEMNTSDHRIGQSWLATIRAERLARGQTEASKVTYLDAADTAVLGVSAALELDERGGRKMIGALVGREKFNRAEKEIIARRYGAAVATKLVHTEFVKGKKYGVQSDCTDEELRDLIQQNISPDSFMRTGQSDSEKKQMAAIDEAIVNLVHPMPEKQQKASRKNKRRR